MRPTHVRSFSDDELVLDERQTRAVLGFFYPAMQVRLKGAVIARELRHLAQAMLVEAVDASLAMSWVEQVCRAAAPQDRNIAEGLLVLDLCGSRGWFRHLKAQNLSDVRIYQAVRERLAASFDAAIRAMLKPITTPHAPGESRWPTAFAGYTPEQMRDSVGG